MSDHVHIAGMPPAQSAAIPPVPKQAEGQKPPEGGGQQQGTVDIDKLTAEITAKAAEAATAAVKSQIDGLNRRNSEIQKEKEELEKAASEKALTVEEQLAAMRADREKDKREMAAKEAEASMREKKLQWQAAATKRKLPADTFVDPSLSVEDGEKYLDSVRGAFDEQLKTELTAQLGAGWKPGTGNLIDGKGGERGYDGNDPSTWTGNETAEQVQSWEQAQIDARNAFNATQALQPGVSQFGQKV